MTSLFVAAKAGQDQMVQFLITRGANVNTVNKVDIFVLSTDWIRYVCDHNSNGMK
jgi:ankyrin repeat protein